MEIRETANQFYIEENGEKIARIDFLPSEENGTKSIKVTHTVVDEAHGGKGLGKKLVHKVAEYARKNDIKIIPECWYAKRVLEKDEKYKDLIIG